MGKTSDGQDRQKRRDEKDCDYAKELSRLQTELVKLQEWVRHKSLKVVAIFEGRDAAGKGGAIKRITESLNPRICRVVALAAPTEREKTQWYFQRYVGQLPAAGEIVLFDRSWYNRAGVERVMGFCNASTWKYPNWGLYYSISYLGLARGSALAGDTAKARKAFQDFFALWKESDADLFLLADARKEYTKLR